MNQDRFWKFGVQEIFCIISGFFLGGAFGFGIFFVKPAPPWWFLPLPLPYEYRSRIDFDSWSQYELQGGYEAFWVQSTWGWALVAAILGLVVSNVVLRKKER